MIPPSKHPRRLRLTRDVCALHLRRAAPAAGLVRPDFRQPGSGGLAGWLCLDDDNDLKAMMMTTIKKPRSENRVKTELIQVRATTDEKIALKNRSAAFGISVGELCRQSIFGMKAKSTVDQQAIQELADARAALGRIGGLLKGWLGPKEFPDAPYRGTEDARDLLHQIERSQEIVLNLAKRLMDTSK